MTGQTSPDVIGLESPGQTLLRRGGGRVIERRDMETAK
jgi:hypothetical protein